MNLYRALQIEIPVMNYLIFHQSREGVSPESYQQTMQELHRLILMEARQIDSQNPDVSAKFIGTVEEHFQKEVLIDPDFAMLVENGKQMLIQLGLNPDNPGSNVYSSSFIFKSALYLDILEHIVRDRLGIYGRVHGGHIGKSDQYRYRVQNLVYESSGNSQKDRSGFRISLFFDKPKIEYGPFRNLLSEVLDEVESFYGFPTIQVWQRKLGLGFGNEFEIRAHLDGPLEVIGRFLRMMRDQIREDLIRQSIFSSGCLLVKEKLW